MEEEKQDPTCPCAQGQQDPLLSHVVIPHEQHHQGRRSAYKELPQQNHTSQLANSEPCRPYVGEGGTSEEEDGSLGEAGMAEDTSATGESDTSEKDGASGEDNTWERRR